MATRDAKEKELWAAFAQAAIGSYERPDDLEELDEVVDDMVSVASTFADAMLDAMDSRYGGAGARRPVKASKRKRREDPEDDEDEDEEDD